VLLEGTRSHTDSTGTGTTRWMSSAEVGILVHPTGPTGNDLGQVKRVLETSGNGRELPGTSLGSGFVDKFYFIF